MTPELRRWLGPVTVLVYAAIGWALVDAGWTWPGAALIALAGYRALRWLRSLRSAAED